MTRDDFCRDYWKNFAGRGCGPGMCGFGQSNSTEETAMDILNKRYARGDIDQREYEEKKRNLEALNK